MEQYQEKQQNALQQQAFPSGAKRTIKLAPGVYPIDESAVKIDFQVAALADNLSLAIRKEACPLFQSLCQVKVDGELMANYQNLFASQLIFYYSNPNYFKDNGQIFTGADTGQTDAPINYQIIYQGTALGDARYQFQWSLRHFLPFLFKSDQKYFQINKWMEITLILSSYTNTLISVDDDSNQLVARSVKAQVAGTDDLRLIFCMQKSVLKNAQVKKLNHVYQQEEITAQTETELKVDDPTKQISQFQAIMLLPQTITPVDFPQITQADLSDCKLWVNQKLLIKAENNRDALAQFQSYQLKKTGTFLIPLFQLGQFYSINIQNSGTNPLNLITLIQYEDEK